MNNHLRILAIILAVAGVLLAVAGLGTIPASRVYCVETELSAAPDNDTALEFWLKNQPGVVQHTVRVGRVTTDHPKLVLTLMMVQNGWLKPPFPDVESKAIDLGYTIDSAGFQNQDRPK